MDPTEPDKKDEQSVVPPPDSSQASPPVSSETLTPSSTPNEPTSSELSSAKILSSVTNDPVSPPQATTVITSTDATPPPQTSTPPPQSTTDQDQVMSSLLETPASPGLDGTTPPPEPPPSQVVEQPPPKKSGRRKAVLLALLLFFLIAVPLTGFYVQQQQQLADLRSRAYPGDFMCGNCVTNATGNCPAQCPMTTVSQTICASGVRCGSGTGPTSTPGPSNSFCTQNLGGTCVAPATCAAGGQKVGECVNNGSLSACCKMGVSPTPPPCKDPQICLSGGECTSRGGKPLNSCGLNTFCCQPANSCIPLGAYCGPGSSANSNVCCGNAVCDTQYHTCQAPSYSCTISGSNTTQCTNVPVGWPCRDTVGASGSCTIESAGNGTICKCGIGGGGPTSTPVPPTPQPGWGACGSCNTCGHAQNECQTNPQGQCVWNPSTCNPQPTTPPGAPTNTPLPEAPTATPVVGQCQNIKIYKGSTLVTDYSTLRAGDAITIAAVGTNATKARIRVNGGSFSETANKNSAGEYTLDYTIPTSGTTSFTIEAELFIGGAWR